jgi:hypothetical protein
LDSDAIAARRVAALDAVPSVAAAYARASEFESREWVRVSVAHAPRHASAAALDATAWHESGHAITAIKLGRCVEGMTLRCDGSGETRLEGGPLALDAYVTALINLAGPAASLYVGDARGPAEWAGGGDVLRARIALGKCATTHAEAVAATCMLIEAHWLAIARVASLLLERRELGGMQLTLAMLGCVR